MRAILSIVCIVFLFGCALSVTTPKVSVPVNIESQVPGLTVIGDDNAKYTLIRPRSIDPITGFENVSLWQQGGGDTNLYVWIIVKDNNDTNRNKTNPKFIPTLR